MTRFQKEITKIKRVAIDKEKNMNTEFEAIFEIYHFCFFSILDLKKKKIL